MTSKEAAYEAMKDNLKQSLLEHLADWLDQEYTKFELGFCQLEETEDCHIKMAEAAFKEFIKDLKPKTYENQETQKR
jgi:hypothetical protein